MAVHKGEAAKPPADVHYGNRLTPTACDLADDEVPFLDQVKLAQSLVTCERCKTALADPSGGSR